MKLSKQDLDATFASLVQKGLARTRAELVAHVNNTHGLKGAEAVDGGTARDSDNALKRLSASGVLSFNKTTKQWDALLSATTETAKVPSVQQEATKPEGTKMKDQTTSNIESIDDAINAAKNTTKKADAPKRAKLSAPEREARDAQNKIDREAKKVQRDALRAEKKATREAAKSAPHMSKVDKAAEKLPVLTGNAEVLFRDITVNSSRDQITALAAHLTHFNRIQATERALKQNVKTGDSVKIIGGDARYVGMTGTVDKSQRIRCYVNLEGVKKPVYLFTSDVEVLTVAKAAVG
jgi:hypothetical protein